MEVLTENLPQNILSQFNSFCKRLCAAPKKICGRRTFDNSAKRSTEFFFAYESFHDPTFVATASLYRTELFIGRAVPCQFSCFFTGANFFLTAASASSGADSTL